VNHSEIAAKLNRTTDPEVALEIASTWSRKEIEEGIAECKELAAESDGDDAAAAVDRLAILELCSPAVVKSCKAHWDEVRDLLVVD